MADLRRRADEAERNSDLAEASAVYNLAALLASDCGLPNLARDLCHRQANAYLRAHPLNAQAARHALEPLVNLARLHIRDGEGQRAFHLIESLYAAISARIDSAIDGVEIPGHLVHSPEAHKEVRRWLWAVLLATGARALAVAGQWQEARTRLRDYKGIGRRMLDGRQVAIIADTTSGDTEHALALLNDTEPGEPWENAVTACLTVVCRGGPSHTDVTGLPNLYRDLDTSAPGLAVFHTRLALSLIDAIGMVENVHARRIANDLIERTINSQDGYAARDLLTHSDCRGLLTGDQARQLTDLVDACALGHGTCPATLLADITTALTATEDVITQLASGRKKRPALVKARQTTRHPG